MNLFFKELKLVNTIEGAIKELEKQIDISPKLYEIIDFIIEAHEGQFRKSGEPYLNHLFGTAKNIASLGMDTTTIVAGFLHDTIEDTGVLPEVVEKEFGKEIELKAIKAQINPHFIFNSLSLKCTTNTKSESLILDSKI